MIESQKDRYTESHKQKEPEAGEELTCCISCRYFGFRSELMIDGVSGIGLVESKVKDGREEDEALDAHRPIWGR
ncbi:uncharacterized protein N7500_004532 [Penicillium coprophilum]|uniref:uncharacterized protein n=1 Tax=Penicillium coprophilum TaxID=36646 RepID=UPI0023A4D70E|nr:uncharacterized protein N7500_004532 [Penicillium coprophilum]KAJ5162702.1 hypothetical protein N7500_004532 [Penicillium coprophilum]